MSPPEVPIPTRPGADPADAPRPGARPGRGRQVLLQAGLPVLFGVIVAWLALAAEAWTAGRDESPGDAKDSRRVCRWLAVAAPFVGVAVFAVRARVAWALAIRGVKAAATVTAVAQTPDEWADLSYAYSFGGRS